MHGRYMDYLSQISSMQCFLICYLVVSKGWVKFVSYPLKKSLGGGRIKKKILRENQRSLLGLFEVANKVTIEENQTSHVSPLYVLLEYGAQPVGHLDRGICSFS